MIGNLSFANEDWFWQVAIVTLVIWFVFVWKEYRKTKKRSLYINSIVALVALISLALIILKPKTVESSLTPFKIALLTEGFDDVQLDSLKKIHKKLQIQNYEQNQVLFQKNKSLDTVFVLGAGLEQYDLWQLDSINTIYLEGAPPKGVNQFVYNIENEVGNEAVFNGRYVKPIQGHKLFLEDPSGQVLDSIEFSNDNVQEFQLSTSLKVKGQFVYQLVEKDALDNTISKDPLPLIIQVPEGLKILIVNASPSFETKYLKNYLAEAGHQVSIRSRLTKGRYKYEYFNTDVRPKIGFTQEQLKYFDVIIIDGLTLSGLPVNARNALEVAIGEDGLGMFIQSEVGFYNSSKRWFSFNFENNRKNRTSLEIDKKAIIAKYPFVFKSDALVEPILKGNSQIVSAYKRHGVGRIGASVLNNTYELKLKGSTETYRKLWANTIEIISKKNIAYTQWHQYSQIAFINEPFNFKLRVIDFDLVVVANNGYEIPLKRDVNIENLWEGVTYPREIGWETITTKQDSAKVFKYFVTDNTHWQSLKLANTIKANKEYFNAKRENSIKAKRLDVPINLLWFFVIFALCIGYLWLEPKL